MSRPRFTDYAGDTVFLGVYFYYNSPATSGLGSLHGCLFFAPRLRAPTISKRSIIYVDGFNFYYGVVRGTAHKWLDLERVFYRLRPDDDIQVIHYFTALVDGRRRGNQETYLRALALSPKIDVILGKFKRKQITCRVAGCTYSRSRVFQTPEEKRTDVNIALQMLDDAHHGRAERFVLVSGDSDLVPALDLIRPIPRRRS